MTPQTTAEKKTRREVMLAMGALAGAGIISPFASSRVFAQSGHIPAGIRFGVQLNAFPINPRHFESFLDTLQVVKQIGYQGFESSFRNVSAQFANPAPARRSIEQTGLTFLGIHIFFPDSMYDKSTHIAAPSVYEPVARGGVALGAKHLILSGAPATTPDQLKAKIEGLNTAGRFAQSVGITLAFHNEHWVPEEIEALYTQTDPSLVHFLFDAGHAYHGGANVPAFIRAHAHRIIGFHLRDFRNGRLVTLGTGTFPLAEVAATIKQIGWKGWVENEEERDDHSQNGAAVIRPAFKALEEAFFQ